MRAEVFSSLRLQTLIREDWVATSRLMHGQSVHDILRQCTRCAKKILHNWEIREVADKKRVHVSHQQDLVALCFQLQQDPQHLDTQAHIQELETSYRMRN